MGAGFEMETVALPYSSGVSITAVGARCVGGISCARREEESTFP